MKHPASFRPIVLAAALLATPTAGAQNAPVATPPPSIDAPAAPSVASPPLAPAAPRVAIPRRDALLDPRAAVRTTPEDVARAVQLGRTLRVYAESERGTRLAAAGGGILLGAAFAAVGAARWAASEDAWNAPAIVLTGAGAGLVLGGVIALFEQGFYGPFERRYVDSLGRQHLPAAEAVRRAEAFWAEQSQRERRMRLKWGVVSIVVGAVSGTAAVATAATTWSSSATGTESLVPALFGAVAGLGIVRGVASLLVAGPVETSYRLWRAGQSRPDLASVRLTGPSLAMTPTTTTLSLGGAF